MTFASDTKDQGFEVPRLLLEGDSYDLWTNQSGQFWNNTYVIVDKESGIYALVDPLHNCLEHWPSFFEEQSKTLNAILITHAHIDHAGGAADTPEDWLWTCPLHRDVLYEIFEPCPKCGGAPLPVAKQAE